MASPRVSVLLPARDAERTLRAAVESVLAGTLGDLELLAVDDGSRDGTRDVLEALASEDARVRVLATDGAGLVPALNLGLAHARGAFVARMDADDVSLPRRLEASVRALEEDASLAGVGTGVELFREDRPVSPSLEAYARWLNGLTTAEAFLRERFRESPLAHPTACLRREAYALAGGYAEGDFPEDYHLWLTLLDRGLRLRNLGEVLLRWRDTEGRASRTDRRYAVRRFTYLKARFLARVPAVRAGPVTVWGAGPTGLTLSRFLAEEGVPCARYVDLHPRKVGTRIHGVPVVPPDALGPPHGHLIVAVGARGAHPEIADALARAGWREGEHVTWAA